jgi:hypothetical protein
LQRLQRGEVLLTLKRRWSDGTFAKLFDPQDLIAKVIALLPAPGANLLRFHGRVRVNHPTTKPTTLHRAQSETSLSDRA